MKPTFDSDQAIRSAFRLLCILLLLTSFAAARKNFALPHELWPWGYHCLSHPMQEFVDKKLTKVMDSDDSGRLIRAEGRWPDYPLAIKEIANKHNLPVPWHTLPGLRERWDRYRLPSGFAEEK